MLRYLILPDSMQKQQSTWRSLEARDSALLACSYTFIDVTNAMVDFVLYEIRTAQPLTFNNQGNILPIKPTSGNVLWPSMPIVEDAHRRPGSMPSPPSEKRKTP